MTPVRSSRSSRACTVPRATCSSRDSSSTPIRGCSRSASSRSTSSASMWAECTATRPCCAANWSSLSPPEAPVAERAVDEVYSMRTRREELTTMTVEQTLTSQERLADLDLDQLRQLVGLVEHDAERDPFPVTGWDAVVWAVGNATQTALHYQLVYGMELVAYSGPETGNRDHQAYVLRSGAVRFVVQGGVDPRSALLDHHRRHGDGIVDIALEVPDVDRCVAHARAQGATVVEEPHDVTDEHGVVRLAAIAAYGEPRHPLVDRPRYSGPSLPGYVARRSALGAPARRVFQALDHVVGNVELGRMDEWIDFYHRIMG